MRIINGDGFWTLIPVSDDEKKMVNSLLDSGTVKGDLLWFFEKESYSGLNMRFNGLSFDFCGDDDRSALEGIRRYARKSSQSIMFFKEGVIDNVRAMSITTGFCKKCKKPINDEISLEFGNICRDCAKKHQYALTHKEKVCG